MSILCNQQDRKRQIKAAICRRPIPITCNELLPALLSFALDSFDELERTDRCFDLAHQETRDSLDLDVLIRDVKLAVSLAASCLSQIRTARTN